MKTRVLSRAEILDQLKTKFPQEKTEILQEASYNLSLASTESSQLQERMARAVERIKATPARKFQVQSDSGGLDICPLCRFQMKSVNLIDDKGAWYCNEHKIVVPHPVKDTAAE